MARQGVAAGWGQDILLERERERSEFEDCVESANSGKGRLLLIEGPAGIGKTRLLDTAVSIAREHAFEILTARASELEREFAFGVVRQLFERRLAFTPSEERESLFEGAAGLATRVLGLDTSTVTTKDRITSGTAGDLTFPTLHGLYWLCSNLAAQAPLVISVDDVHSSDAPSLHFLAYLTRRIEELPILMILAARAAEPEVEPLVAALSSEPLARVIRPAPLSEAAVETLVRASLTEAAEDEFCRACHRATGGNPLLLRELVGELRANSVSPTAAEIAAVHSIGPQTVTRMVLERLARLPQATAILAQAVAVLGGRAELRHAAALAALDRRVARDAWDELADAGILEREAPLRFIHPIVSSAIYADISPAKRANEHERAAQILADDGMPAEQVALHLLGIEPGAEAWRVELLRDAAQQALNRGAANPAVTYLRRALAEPPDDCNRASVLLELGSAERAAQEPDAAEHLDQALELTDDLTTRGRVAGELAGVLHMSGRAEEAVRVLERASADIAAVDGELALRLEAELCTLATLHRSTWPLAVERLEQVSTGIEGKTPGERLLLAIRAHETGRAGSPAPEAVELAERALAGGKLLTDQTPDSAPFYFALYVLMAADCLELAEQYLEQALADARARGSLLGFAIVSCYRSGLALRRGSVRDGEAEARASLDAGRLTDWTLLPVALGYLIDSLMELDELDTAEEELREGRLDGKLPEETPFNALLSSRGRLRLAAGETESALEDLLELVEREERWRSPHPAATDYRSHAALALSMAGEQTMAQRLAEREVKSARRWGVSSVIGRALRVAGLVEGGEEGLQLLHEAASVLETSPAELERARALVDLGAAIRRDGQRSAAREPLRRGLDLAHRCGAVALAGRARDELLATGARPRRPLLSGVDSLTGSERRVAKLAALGMTNREIAQALFVTTRTVEVHLTSVYRKLGIRSREELPASLSGEEHNQPRETRAQQATMEPGG